MTNTGTSLPKRNLIAINQPNQQFWDVFLIKRTVVNTLFYSIQTKSRHALNMIYIT